MISWASKEVLVGTGVAGCSRIRAAGPLVTLRSRCRSLEWNSSQFTPGFQQVLVGTVCWASSLRSWVSKEVLVGTGGRLVMSVCKYRLLKYAFAGMRTGSAGRQGEVRALQVQTVPKQNEAVASARCTATASLRLRSGLYFPELICPPPRKRT